MGYFAAALVGYFILGAPRPAPRAPRPAPRVLPAEDSRWLDIVGLGFGAVMLGSLIALAVFYERPYYTG